MRASLRCRTSIFCVAAKARPRSRPSQRRFSRGMKPGRARRHPAHLGRRDRTGPAIEPARDPDSYPHPGSRVLDPASMSESIMLASAAVPTAACLLHAAAFTEGIQYNSIDRAPKNRLRGRARNRAPLVRGPQLPLQRKAATASSRGSGAGTSRWKCGSKPGLTS